MSFADDFRKEMNKTTSGNSNKVSNRTNSYTNEFNSALRKKKKKDEAYIYSEDEYISPLDMLTISRGMRENDDIAPIGEGIAATARNTWDSSYYNKWGKYADEADYKEYSAKGANIVNPTVREAEGWANIFGWRPGAKDVGNIVTYSRDNAEGIKMGELNSSKMVGNSNYRWMTEDEVGIYNYLLAKQGKEKAQEYLDDMEEELNRREGIATANNIQSMDDGVAKALMFGLQSYASGAQSALTGIQQQFTSDNLPTSALQFSNQKLASDLDGAAKILYSSVNTIGNMTPSILLSHFTGGVLGGLGASSKVATIGSQIAGAASMGASAAGNAYGWALDEGYSKGQARLYSNLVGASEGGLQYALGGISALGGKAIGKAMPSVANLSNKIAMIDNSLLRIAAKYGESISKEIAEEELQNYLEPAFRSIVFGEEYDAPTVDELIETALVTALSTGVFETSSIAQSEKSIGENERTVIKSLVDKEISKKEEAGEKVTAKDKNKIYEDIVEEMEKGRLSVDDIEIALNGNSYNSYQNAIKGFFESDTYKKYKETVATEDALAKELKELGKKEGATPADNYRYTELMQKMNETQATSKIADMKAQLDSEVKRINEMRSNLIQERLNTLGNNSKLAESYREAVRANEKYQADVSKYKGEYAQKTIQNLLDSDLGNNTNEFHEFADWLARLSEDRGVVFSLTDAKRLKGTRYEYQGRTTNAYLTDDGNVVLNVDSRKKLNSSVGHEIWHVLEQSGLGNELQQAIKEWANNNNSDYDTRYAAMQDLYAQRDKDGNIIRDQDGNIVLIKSDVDFDSEVTADLIGDYIFTDKEFLKNLSVKHQNAFMAMWNEIKYMVKIATAGSKTEKELLAIKKQFEDIWREAGKFQVKTAENAEQENSAEVDTDVITDEQQSESVENSDVQFSIRKEDPPKETGVAYKVFYVKDGKLYPPMVANPDGADTPMGVWLNADVGAAAPASKTGRAQVKAGGKGTQGGSGSLAFRPGWHLGDLPRASQFDRVNPETGNKELFPKDFVWAEVEYAKDVDYQEEAMSYGYTDNGKFRHAYAGLPKLPENGYYRYRTNPKPDTVPWVITGAMKVNRLLSDAEVNEILEKNGVPAVHRQGGDVGLEKFGFDESGKSEVKYSLAQVDGVDYVNAEKSIFTKEDGTTASERDIFNSLVGKTLSLPDGDIEIVKNLPGKKMYDELYRRYPKNLGGVKDVKQLNSDVNYNMEELLSNSEMKNPNVPDRDGRHAEQGITDFDTRTVKFYDGSKAYTVDFSIATLESGKKIAYAKKFFGYDAELTKKIQTVESRRSKNTPFNQQSVSVDNSIAPLPENVKYSISTDSEGRQLSKSQAEYFKDSKVKDENGNLLVMYHGTPNYGFTEFKSGSYFTQHKNWADVYQTPSASSISTGKKLTNPGTYAVYLDIKKPFDTRNKKERDIFYKDYYQQWGTGTDLMESGLPDWTDGLDLQEFIEEKGYDYDGLILDESGVGGYSDEIISRGLSYVTFSPEQVKNVDNLNPTSEPDIRFSLSKPVEETKTLVAIHNLQSSELAKTLELGGLPMPSIAVIKAEQGHEEYGDVSLIFPKNANMPTGYFEAKPQRAVGLEEVGVFVIPNNADVKLKQELLNNGYRIAEYDPNIEGDRKRVVNQFEEYKFSLSNVGEENSNYGDYAVYGKDIKYRGQDLAPLADDVAPVKEGIAKKPTTTNSEVQNEITPVAETGKEKNAPVDIAPVAESQVAPAVNEMETSSAKQERIANILTEEPAVEKKKGRTLQRFMTNFVDKGSVFENLSLKTKNRALQEKYNTMHYSATKAQRLIGKGTKDVKSLNSIKETVDKSGKTGQFYDYLYHKHNIDRMSLETEENRAKRESLQKSFKGLKDADIKNIAREKVTQETPVNIAERIKKAREYVKMLNHTNKPVFGYSVTADVSKAKVSKYESQNPDFKKWAEDVYTYNRHLKKLMVDNGVISQETSDLWDDIYPHYVPIRRAGMSGSAIKVPLDTGKTDINAPVKKAKGGNSDILPLFDTMAQRTMQTFKAIDKNSFGIELKNTLNSTIEKQSTTMDDVIDSIDNNDGLLQEGKYGRSPTFTVFENGERVTFEITEDMYDAMKPTSEALSKTYKIPNTISNARRSTLTEYNPVFLIKNFVKDFQDVLINSQHAAKTYANMPVALKEMAAKGKYYTEYLENGGEQNTYFDSKTNSFDKKNKALEIVKTVTGLNAIAKANNIVEITPRLAEYIASRKTGKSIDGAMLDAARVTTNFQAGGDITKFANRNGATFLNASVQGAMQQVRNIREAKMNGLRGWASLAAKYLVAGLPLLALNHFIWDDDEDFADLSDYVKQNYYIVGKYGDGKFVRIPKGRTVAVIQNAFEQMKNAITGDDDVDLKTFLNLVVDNLAPNNPIDNNIISPIIQVANNETWYGEDLVPTRLQDVPASEQYDESTDEISKWLGEKLNFSPAKINYLLDQYSGVVGDIALPMLTPEAESDDDFFGSKMIAPLKDSFTTDSVMKNQNISDFYSKKDELTVNANASNATDEDVLKSMYMNASNSELSNLYKQKREIQNSSLSDSAKYAKVRKIQNQIAELASESLDSFDDVNISGKYATVGEIHYRWYEPGEDSTSEPGWKRITDKQLAKQKEVTSNLGIDASTYWENKEEHDLAYENPGRYAVSKAIGGYKVYKQYNSDLNDIKADKDEAGEAISGSRKEKVIDYINNLDADYGSKIVMLKSEYPSDDTYNSEIVDYINNHEDLTYDERVTILLELGFKVDNGNVYWD